MYIKQNKSTATVDFCTARSGDFGGRQGKGVDWQLFAQGYIKRDDIVAIGHAYDWYRKRKDRKQRKTTLQVLLKRT